MEYTETDKPDDPGELDSLPREILEAAFAAVDQELELDEHDIESWAATLDKYRRR